MPKVFGLVVPDEGMARIAKLLLTAHLVIIAICAVYGLVQCVEHFVVQGAWDDWRKESGNEKTNSGTPDILSGSIAIVWNVGGPLLLPVLGFFAARSGIQGNSMGLMQATCMMNGYCVCCTGFVAMSMIWSFFSMLEQQAWLEEGECREDYFYHPDVGGYKDGNYDREDCVSFKDTYHDVLGIWATINLLLGILCCCNVAACLLGTVKANQATNALGQQQFFCAQPGMAVIGGPPNGPGPSGMVMVVGQPVGTQVPMGQPVSGGDPTNTTDAKVAQS